MKFYMVTCARGHVGNRKETDIKFAIMAENLLNACDIARKMPSVKHSRMVCYGHEITEQEFNDYRTISAYKRFEQHKRIRGR